MKALSDLITDRMKESDMQAALARPVPLGDDQSWTETMRIIDNLPTDWQKVFKGFLNTNPFDVRKWSGANPKGEKIRQIVCKLELHDGNSIQLVFNEKDGNIYKAYYVALSVTLPARSYVRNLSVSY